MGSNLNIIPDLPVAPCTFFLSDSMLKVPTPSNWEDDILDRKRDALHLLPDGYDGKDKMPYIVGISPENIIFKQREDDPNGDIVMFYDTKHVTQNHLKNDSNLYCKYCDYKHEQKQKLENHLFARHYEEKRYKCPHCDHASAVSQNLKTHIKKMHPNLALPPRKYVKK